MRSLVFLATLASCGGGKPAPTAAPPPAIDGILDLFATHPVVAIGEHHRSVEQHAFLRDLIRHPRFAATVDDIIVEFAGGTSQPILDRYVAGEPVSDEELRSTWREGTQLLVWDAPMYRELLETVREVNRTAPKKLRVLAGDPAIIWRKVRTGADFVPFAGRDPDTARVIEREVLARGRKGLLVIGDAHIPKRDPLVAARGRPASPTVTQLLPPASVHVIETVLGEPKLGAPLSLHKAVGTPLGQRSFGDLTGGGEVTILRQTDAGRVPYTVRPTDYPRIEDVVDSVLYIGPTSTSADAAPGSYADPRWVEELRRRARILREVYGFDLEPDVDEAARTGR